MPPRRLTWIKISLKFGFEYVSRDSIRSACSMKDLSGTPAEYQELRKPFRESEHGQTIVPDTLMFRWWQFLCAVSVANILLWTLVALGLSREANTYQFKQLIFSVLFVAACAFLLI